MQSQEPETRLAAIESRISLPGCEIHRNGIVIDDSVTPEQLSQIGSTLRTVNESGLWWWGDYLNFCEFKRGVSYEAATAESDYSYSSLAKARRVCAAFEFSNRLPSLGFAHHMDALNECQGKVEKAIEWLKWASEEKWSVSQMREAIRKGEAKHKERDPGQPSVVGWMIKVSGWFKKEATPEAARELLPRLEAAITECRRIAGV